MFAPALPKREAGQDTLPVCLRVRLENPHRLVSLWDMLRFLAHDFVSVMQNLRLLEGKLAELGKTAYDPREVGTIIGHLGADCTNLELPSASKQIQRIKRRFDESLSVPEEEGLTVTEMAGLLTELRRRVEEDLEEGVLFWVEPSKIRMFFARTDDDGQSLIVLKNADALLSPQIVQKFPSAVQEFEEAVKSFVNDRSTGCVFHLMRALEFGLAALGKIFNVSLEHTNWGPAIEKIESEIREMHNDAKWRTLPDWKDQHEFYSQVASHFGVLKDAWRNHTAHVRSKYDQEDALEILQGVRAFFRKLARRLSE